jgi:hypothetical protein
MKNEFNLIMILSLIILLLLIFRKPIQKAMTRGYRNNNPGNIRRTPSVIYEGEIQGTDNSFKTFKSMAYGYRAMFSLLTHYANHGLTTINSIINTYAPGNENNTEAYIRTVSNKTGLDPLEEINFSDTNTFKNLVAAISFVENGLQPDFNDIDNGLKLLYA